MKSFYRKPSSIRLIIDQDDVCQAPRCCALKEKADLLQQAKDWYSRAVVVPEVVATLHRKLPAVR